jgi:hypothetical protein
LCGSYVATDLDHLTDIGRSPMRTSRVPPQLGLIRSWPHLTKGERTLLIPAR